MKILVLSRYTRMGASSRLRMMQYVPKLISEDFKIEVFPFFDDKHLESQYGTSKISILDILRYFFRRFKHLRFGSTPDLIWIEYEILPWLPWFVERLILPKKIPIITDYDDAIFHRYDMHRFKVVRYLLGLKISKIMNRSKIVIAGNNYLADYAFNSGSSNVKVVPTVVDLEIYKLKNLKKNNNPIRIGWIGTPMTYKTYLEEKLPMLKNLAAKEGFKFCVMGAKNINKQIHSSIDFIEWSEETEVSFIQSLDVGIMPLHDSAWARGKCGYKIVQYMACGIPVIASPVGVNREIIKNGVNGYLANSSEEWIEAIKILINDGDLRQRLGSEGRKLVERKYSLQIWSTKIDQIFRELIDNEKNYKENNQLENKTIISFGEEWRQFNQKKLIGREYLFLFKNYFHLFPWSSLPKNACGFDMGCGSGRWALLVAPKVGKLTCIDPSKDAIKVAKNNLSHLPNIVLLNASVFEEPLPINSQDFGYCLGVLHHVKDTAKGLKECVKMLKPGAPFLIYLYYNFENRPKWYYYIWQITDFIRKFISKLPSSIKLIMTNIIASLIYFPFARIALISEKLGFNVNSWLLSGYRHTSFYTMKTDSRDRFGTPLEKRFSRSEIHSMMIKAGLTNIIFSKSFPFWCAIGKKKVLEY